MREGGADALGSGRVLRPLGGTEGALDAEALDAVAAALRVAIDAYERGRRAGDEGPRTRAGRVDGA